MRMADGRNDVRQVCGEVFSSDCACSRIRHEYDFFSEAIYKLKYVYKLPVPQNPQALREFFVTELVGERGIAQNCPDQTTATITTTTSLKGNEKKQGGGKEKKQGGGKKKTQVIKKKEDPVLLFEKVLELSDVLTDELLILKSEKVMGFLSGEG